MPDGRRPPTSALEFAHSEALEKLFETTRQVVRRLHLADPPTLGDIGAEALRPPPPVPEGAEWMPPYWLEKYREPFDVPSLTRIAAPYGYFLRLDHAAAPGLASDAYERLQDAIRARRRSGRRRRDRTGPAYHFVLPAAVRTSAYQRWKQIRAFGIENPDDDRPITLGDLLRREEARYAAARSRFAHVLRAVMAEAAIEDSALASALTNVRCEAARGVSTWIAERTPSGKPHWPDVAIGMWLHGWDLGPVRRQDNPAWKRLGHQLEVEVARAPTPDAGPD
jgi:hypothetical protein